MEPTNAGIITVGEERWIPGSRRPDGTYRKERKVREGFTPLEDLQRYSNPRTRDQPKSAYPPGYTPKKKAEPEKKPKNVNKSPEAPPPQPTAPTSEIPAEERKLKTLQKKLRQIEELEARLIKGEKLNEAQIEKVQRGKSVREEIAKLTSSGSV